MNNRNKITWKKGYHLLFLYLPLRQKNKENVEKHSVVFLAYNLTTFVKVQELLFNETSKVLLFLDHCSLVVTRQLFRLCSQNWAIVIFIVAVPNKDSSKYA